MNIKFEKFGSGDLTIVWAHGWGRSLADMRGLANSLGGNIVHVLVDLPGFGGSDNPPDNWGTQEYADAMAGFIKDYGKVVWIGHSFGGKVGIALAAQYPHLIQRLILISSSGLLGKRRAWVSLKIAAFKLAKRICPWAARKFFGSGDYKNAGSMRNVFVRIVNEQMDNQAAEIKCPVLLFYGQDDDQTPPEIGQRLANIIPNSHLEVLPRTDHYNILTQAKHVIAAKIKGFLS